MISFSTQTSLAKVFPVVKTERNDRRRARSQRKSSGFDFNLANKLKDDFAREAGEFGLWWSKEYNDYELPTPRQVLAGLQKFFEMQLDKMLAIK